MDAQADLSLHYMHMSIGTFSHVAVLQNSKFDQDKMSSDFPSNQSFSAHARFLSEATSLVSLLRFHLGLPLI